MLIWISIILLLITTTESKAIKILLISPKFGGSHVKFTGSIADKLVEAGFEVVCSFFMFCVAFQSLTDILDLLSR